jgi:hypothetical protein
VALVPWTTLLTNANFEYISSEENNFPEYFPDCVKLFPFYIMDGEGIMNI